MSDNLDGEGSGEGLSTDLVNQKGSGNKRKFFSDLSLDIPVDVTTLSLTEFPRYEMLEEKFHLALNEWGSPMASSEETNEEKEVEVFSKEDWDNPISCQLEELLTINLYATFMSAVKQIVECGYTKEVAEWGVLNSGLYHGVKEAVSNVVDGALALLRREKDFNFSNHPLFDGLQNLVEYTIVEMIHVLREVRPALTVAEAMWYLLISDLNLVHACVIDAGVSGNSSIKETCVESSLPTIPTSKDEMCLSGNLDSYNFKDSRRLMDGTQSLELSSVVKEGSLTLQEAKERISGINLERIQTSALADSVDEKSVGSRKSSSVSKRDMLRQKTFQFEKSYKGRMAKGALKAKVAAWGSMVFDKSMKSQSGSSTVVMKGAYSKLTTSAGISCSHVEEKRHPSGNPQSDVPDGVLCVKDPVSHAVISRSPESSAPGSKPSSNDETYAVGYLKSTDYYAAIPYDETLQKYVPQNEKDENILALVPYKLALEKELQSWIQWANEKVMQATRRLGKLQGELKMLRQEKEETEKMGKERQTLEENTAKRLSEMENALSNASGQIEMANSAVRRLGEENSVLKKEMEAAKLQATKSAASFQESLQREQEATKKFQLWDAEKGTLMEQLSNLKHQITELESRIENTKGRVNQFKVLMNQEEKEKFRATSYIDSLRAKKEEEDALMREEEEKIKQVAEREMMECKEVIKNLESAISELRLESDKSKIAALNAGYGCCFSGGEDVSKLPRMQFPKISKRLAVFQDNFGAGSVKPERECVMCMTDEISVVFLPCAHQVLCRQCSNLLEKEGMSECPSCRASIHKRILVGYRCS